jgi:hypothetical protein
MDGNPTVIALIGTVFGGAGLKIVESLLSRGKAESEVAASIRAELRTDVGSLRSEIRSLQTEVDTWREKYYVLLERLVVLETQQKVDEHWHQIHTKEHGPKTE